MSKAGQELDQGDPQGAQEQQAQAESQLAQAEEALEEEKKRLLQRLNERDLSKLQEKQKELEKKTEDLAKQIQESAEKSEQEEAQARKRAARRLQQAQESQQQASQSMGQQDEQQAEENQEQALKELEEARKELEKKEQEYANLQQEEELYSMVEMLDEVIRIQEEVNKQVRALDAIKVEKGALGRRDKGRLMGLARVEDRVREEVAKVKGLLEQESAVVYAYQMKSVDADIEEIQRQLRDFESGEITQDLQADVLARLVRLREALNQERKRRDKEEQKQEEQEQQQQQGKKRLIPPLAELKMLRQMQEDVNGRTRGLYDALRASGQKDLNRVQKRLLSRVVTQQGNIRDLLEAMNDVLKQQAQQGAEADKAEGDEKKEEGK